jgi:hypothetical protein
MVYISAEEEEELYELRDKQLKDFKKNILLGRDSLTEIRSERPEKIILESRQAMPRMEEEEIQSLKRLTPQVMGNLFDRVDFLRQRIDETKEAVEIRKRLHKEVIEEIDTDIKEKQEIEGRLADINEKRNFKLDISILRKEKRHEMLQFWRDILELRTELRELLEEYKTEGRIAGIFKDIDGGKR